MNESVFNSYTNKEVIHEIEQLNPFQDHITYSTILSLCSEPKHRYFRFNAINLGARGAGKSFLTYNLCKDVLKPKRVVYSHSIFTPKGFFRFCSKHKNKNIIFDEADTLWWSSRIKYMLKQLMFASSIAWETSRAKDYESFDFTGSFTINLNSLPFKSKSELAILDRVYYNQVSLNNEMIAKLSTHFLEHKMDKQVWEAIRNRIKALHEEGNLGLTREEIVYVHTFYRENLLTTLGSLRGLSRLKELLRCIKRFFGCFGKEERELFERLAPRYI